ncbi:Cyclopropane-fatty-acyl-phospholipid synthase [Delftia acidovorans SPH-1]|uniref:Cyclopropane-fatty-acyl-phospholipid synthase n=1 Tax=Delftia acidovorans (strain DSM 14801 / SPH-1) TaxID=398578 RepID=A9C149_DELAS|nr:MULTISPECIES: cyclopropane-fatty-acyl-phospholipid synthase family protein [Delftia]MBA4002258.1 class I SAM-dependent methyltransferase [Delftia sp.]ABX38512.1 Cyclopropane-fatty-acyl-phospholipid synthase [Delftia acidovorans SPH-1]MBN9322533.1 class I SAM-dependent methyltransferase [Delftia acidovorans]MCP4015644.1 class I SAM-dependent methyltransferase [Delftia sp.]MCP4518651.1 class I SAM-dependent methyltransferase [Delftia sp.]
MNTTAAPLLSPSAAAPRRTPARARRVLNLLERLPHGQLDLEQPDGRLLHLPRPPSGAADAHCVLHDWQALERTLKSGDIGLAEGYIAGEWDSPDLAALLRLCMANRDHVQSLVYGSWWGRLGYRLRHLLQRNTRAGSARNIHAHYDLGNDFYRLWLDPGMSYSAAWFQGRTGQALRNADLQEAQQAKLRRTLDEVRLQPGQRLLEIGCGWGGLAEAAAQEFGARVTGVTLSREQLVWGQQRMQQAGLADAVELRYQDYRDLPARHAGEPFDAIVSIEMFEAVGREYWRGYFQTLRDCLKPGGLACIQTITLREDLFARYLRSTDFIQQYIFPGGLLPSIPAFEQEAHRAGLVVERRMAFGRDYAETLRRWRQSFEERLEAVRAQGFDERFVRIWTFYLAYCEAAFDTGNTDVVQFTLRKPLP